jgi:hypothetical protein
MALALAEMAMVADGFTRERRAARNDMNVPWGDNLTVIAMHEEYIGKRFFRVMPVCYRQGTFKNPLF